jgi:hypothetical protein
MGRPNPFSAEQRSGPNASIGEADEAAMLTFVQQAANRSEKAGAARAVELVPASEEHRQRSSGRARLLQCRVRREVAHHE